MSVGHTAVTADLSACAAPDHPDCGVRDLLDLLGDRWSVLAVVELGDTGVRRFGELRRSLHGISQRMLTVTLRKLERDGLVLRTVYPTVPATVTYELTDRGASLTHLVKQLVDWSSANKAGIERSREDWDLARESAHAP